MHTLRGVIASAFLLLPLTNGSFAQESYYAKGRVLVSYCQETLKMVKNEKYDTSKSSWCLGFVQASVMSHQLFSALITLKTPGHENLGEKEFMKKVIKNQVYCVPKEVTLGHIVKDIVTFLDANPKYQKEYASTGILYALHKIYPCKK